MVDGASSPPQLAKSSILSSSLKVGALCGTGGLLLGGVFGTIRTRTPILFSLASGFQCFALGSTFWATRSTILSAYAVEHELLPHHRSNASGVAGALTGGLVGGIFRGRGNIIPGVLVLGSSGYAGARLYHWFEARSWTKQNSTPSESDVNSTVWDRLMSSKWSLMKSISDEEYCDRLNEQLLRVDAEIAILDEDIETLKAEERGMSTQQIHTPVKREQSS